MNQLCRTSHPNIIQIFRHDKLHPNSEFYFIDMELCDCNLEEYIYGRKRPLRLMSWDTAIAHGEGPFLVCVITLHIASGLKFIHEKDQVHRDLNPQNSNPPFPRVN